MSTSPMMKQCPRCQQEQAKIVGDQRAVCSVCSKALQRVYQFCWACRQEWQGENGSNSCDLLGCGLKAALLSEDVITDSESFVQGCPFFRACPTCKALLTHSGEGCPSIVCLECNTSFCFRCLREECDGYDYDDDDDDNDDDDDDDDSGSAKLCTVVDNSKAIDALGF